MQATLEKRQIYVGSSALWLGDRASTARREERVHVLGVQFGPMLLAAGCSLEEALDEWDERHGERVDVVADASTLADYDGATVAEQVENAMACGDIRVNDGGTMVWVSHYEWCRSFRTVREAGQFFRTVGGASC